MRSYIIQNKDQQLYLSLQKSIGRILSNEMEFSDSDANRLLRYSYGVIEVSDQSRAKKVSEALLRLGFDHFVLTEDEFVIFPKTILLGGKLPVVGEDVGLIAAGVVLKELPSKEFHFRGGRLFSSFEKTKRQRIQKTTNIDIFTSDEHFRIFIMSSIFPERIRQGLKEIVKNASAIHLDEEVKRILEGKRQLVTQFSKEQFYDRYVSWLVQLRYSGYGDVRPVRAPHRGRIRVSPEIFKLATPAVPNQKEKTTTREKEEESLISNTGLRETDIEIIGGYRIFEKIGSGGMAIVYRAEQVALGRIVAMKILPPHLARDSSFVQRFLNEARAMAALNHPNIVQIYDVGQEGETNYYTMELVGGASLENLLSHRGRLSSEHAINIIRKVANALAYLHECGIVHRDVKPSNILISERGTVKLADFGLALQENVERVTRAGGIVGTPEYMSPEQAVGKVATDLSDIYSLGAVFYEVLTGIVPFEAETPLAVLNEVQRHELDPPRSINSSIPADLERIVLKMMAKNPRRRYQNGRSILEALKQFQARDQSRR